MVPGTKPRRKKNSSRVNLLISFIFHTTMVVALIYFAAREGLLGKQLKKIAVEIVREKEPTKPNEPDKPREEPPKPEPPKIVEAPKVEAPRETAAVPPPATTQAPAVAPPTAEVPS